MSESGRFAPRPAFEVAAGNAVLRRTAGGRPVLALKVQRRGKNYVQDYVVDLVPTAEPEPRPDFVDPETELVDCGAGVRIEVGPAEARNPADPGDLVETAEGLHLAVREESPPYRFVAFVNLATGNLRRLRAGAVTARYATWRVVGLAGEPPLPLADLLARIP